MSSSGVCPALYKDSKGKFYCKYAGGAEVDPAFMPCLMEYWECPYYVQAAKAKKMEAAAKEKEEAGVSVVQPEETTRVVSRPPTAVAVEAEEESLGASELENLIYQASELTKSWEEYERAAREVIEKWEELRDRLERELLSIDSSLEAYAAELNRIELKHKLGVLDENQFEDLKKELEGKISEKMSEKENLQRKIEELDRLVIPHYKRVKAAEVKPEIAKLRIALSKLEQKFKEGGITEDLYKKLKAELEAKLKRLEAIREEVEA